MKTVEEAERLIREVLESGRLGDSLWEKAALEWVGDPCVYCPCAEPIFKFTSGTHTEYCTRCGWNRRPTGDTSGEPK